MPSGCVSPGEEGEGIYISESDGHALTLLVKFSCYNNNNNNNNNEFLNRMALQYMRTVIKGVL